MQSGFDSSSGVAEEHADADREHADKGLAMSLKTQEQIRNDWIARLSSTEGVDFEQPSNELEALYALRKQSAPSLNPVERLKVAPDILCRRLSRLGKAMLIENQLHAVEKKWALTCPRRWRWGKRAMLDAHALGILSEQDGNVQFAHPAIMYYFVAVQLKRWMEDDAPLPDQVIAVLHLIAESGHSARPAIGAIVSLLSHASTQSVQSLRKPSCGLPIHWAYKHWMTQSESKGDSIS